MKDTLDGVGILVIIFAGIAGLLTNSVLGVAGCLILGSMLAQLFFGLSKVLKNQEWIMQQLGKAETEESNQNQ